MGPARGHHEGAIYASKFSTCRIESALEFTRVRGEAVLFYLSVNVS